MGIYAGGKGINGSKGETVWDTFGEGNLFISNIGFKKGG
jgi:hypothetical protein